MLVAPDSQIKNYFQRPVLGEELSQPAKSYFC
jgi:hypothetical protein